MLFNAETKTYLAPGMYDVTGTRLKLSNFNFFACDKSGDPDCFLLKESEIPEIPATGIGVADLELWALLGFLLSLSFNVVSEFDSESLEKSLEESFPEADIFWSFFLAFFFFFLSFFLSVSLPSLSLSWNIK